jgi:hypothetical protein
MMMSDISPYYNARIEFLSRMGHLAFKYHWHDESYKLIRHLRKVLRGVYDVCESNQSFEIIATITMMELNGYDTGCLPAAVLESDPKFLYNIRAEIRIIPFEVPDITVRDI